MTCADCSFAQIKVDMDTSEVNAVTTEDTLKSNSFAVTTPASITFGATLTLPTKFGSYNIIYNVYDKPRTSTVLYSITSELFVTGNLCNQDAKVDRAVYPLPESGLPLFTKSILYGGTLQISFAGISNGDCDFLMEAMPTPVDPAQIPLFNFGIASSTLTP